MPTPTKAELYDQLNKLCKVPDQLYQFGASNTPNYLDMENSVVEALEGDHAADVTAGLKNFRGSLSSLYLSLKPQIERVIRNIASIAYGYPRNLGIDDIFRKISTSLVAQAETLASRNITFGAVAPDVGNSSDGNILRTTQDSLGNDIESGEMGTIKFIVTQDKAGGAEPGNEIVTGCVQGITKVDEIDIGTGPAANTPMPFVRADNGLLKNASFDQITDPISNTEQTGWTLSSAANFTKITESTTPSNIFRYQRGEQTSTTPKGAALRFDDNANIVQYMSRQQVRFSETEPYFLVLRYMRKNSADGTLTLRLGTVTTSVTMTTATNDVWADLVIGETSGDGFYRNFREDFQVTPSTGPAIGLGVRVQVTLSGRTTGEVIVDEVVLAKGTKYNGLWYLPIAGSRTGDAILDDFWNFTDSATEAGRTTYTLHRLFGNYLGNTTTGVATYPDA